MLIFGTRPEAIKLAPVIFALKRHPARFDIKICVTAQHRLMLDQVLDLFSIKPDYDMNIMSKNQSLFDITTRTMTGLKKILSDEKPDIIIVQGDTTAAFISALAAFYCKIPIGHVEAGLRTYDKYQPFPEEKNRHLISVLADFNFAPTARAQENLISEGISPKKIWITGNTVIDALFITVEKQNQGSFLREIEKYFSVNWKISKNDYQKMILVTGHRRESFGEGFKNICRALKTIAQNNPDASIIYPVHLNPSVRTPVFEILGKSKNIRLIDPLGYSRFVYLMNKSKFILTDSGGIQEEAISLKKPLLIMRAATERPEGVAVGAAKLTGTDADLIVLESQKLLDDEGECKKMIVKKNPYGDGNAAVRIADILACAF